MITRPFKPSLDLSSASYGEVKRQFLALAQDLGLKEEHLPVWEKVEAFFSELVVSSGWNRKKIFEMVRDVLNNHSGDLPDEASEALTDYEGALAGDCAIECVPHFPGEPTNLAEFRKYVYSEGWLE